MREDEKLRSGMATCFSGIVLWILVSVLGPSVSQNAPYFQDFEKVFTTVKTVTLIVAALSFIIGVLFIVESATQCNVFELIIETFTTSDEFDERTLNLFYIDKKHHKKYVKIKMKHLSEDTAHLLYYNIQQPLKELYAQAKEHDKEEVFVTFEPYIIAIGSELTSAIRECITKQMEERLLERIPVVTQTISWMQERLQREIEEEIREEKEMEELKNDILIADYHPMEVLENLNTLLRDDPYLNDTTERVDDDSKKKERKNKKNADTKKRKK